VSLYFKTIGKRSWVFFGKFADGLNMHLRSFGYVKIQMHRLIKGEAHPFDPQWMDYLTSRKSKSRHSLF
jgi:RNA-directed DNA polymerase